MPQRLSDVKPEARFSIANAGRRPLAARPKLAVLVSEAIASWSNVESFMLRLFIELVGGRKSTAADMFLALETGGPKKAAIGAAAKSRLSDEHLELLRAIMAVADTNEKERNKLAHWAWGESDDIPDGLLLLDPKSLVTMEFDSEFAKRLSEKIYVYKQRDLESQIAANDRLCGYGLRLQFIITGHVANQDGELFQKLLAEPEIQDRLKILRDRKARSTSEEQPQSPPPGTPAPPQN
jgi:hypothetical protein